VTDTVKRGSGQFSIEGREKNSKRGGKTGGSRQETSLRERRLKLISKPISIEKFFCTGTAGATLRDLGKYGRAASNK